MNIKEFLTEIENIKNQLSPEAQIFLQELIQQNKNKTTITEIGKKILITMSNNKNSYSNIFSAKQLGELLFMSARSVSGSMRKMITEQYVCKNGCNPVTYSITEKGLDAVKEL